VYRDKGYTDLVNTFLRRKALGVEANSNNATNASFKQRPWLAVASFVNPHDIGAYPSPWMLGIQPVGGERGPRRVVPPGACRRVRPDTAVNTPPATPARAGYHD
jgi:hypothetical protein